MMPLHAKHLLVPSLLFGLAAISFTAWYWHQNTRPGKVHYERGLDYAAAKQIPQAETEWLTGAREDPKFPDNHTQLGDLYAAQARFPEAAAQYEMASRLTSQDSTLFQRLAKAEDSAGKTDAALSASCQAASLRPDDAEAQADCGIRAAKLNQPVQAIPFLKRAHTLAPDNANDLIYLVRTEFQTNDLAEVERDLTPFVNSHPDNAEACFLMATLLSQKPATPAITQTVLGYAQRASAGAPMNTEAKVLLGQVLLEAKQPAQALAVFQQAQRLSPSSITALHGLLACDTRLHRLSSLAQTKALLNAALARKVQMVHAADLLQENPANTSAALTLAHLREENGDMALAQTYYHWAVRHAPQNAHAQAALQAFLQRQEAASPR